MDAPTPAQRTLVCAGCLAALREPPWPRCPRCHVPRGTGRAPTAACFECASWSPSVTHATASAVLEPPADALAHALKYGGWAGLAEPLGARMARLCPVPSDMLVVPVPTTAGRARRRGYNQAELLARSYAGVLGSRVLLALERDTEGPSQVALAPDQRRRNVEGAFAVRAGISARLRGRAVALIDDVLTTGATVCAAAKVLERAGAAGVTVITFARALPGRDDRA